VSVLSEVIQPLCTLAGVVVTGYVAIKLATVGRAVDAVKIHTNSIVAATVKAGTKAARAEGRAAGIEAERVATRKRAGQKSHMRR